MAWGGYEGQKLDSIDKSLKSMVQSYDRLLDKFELLVSVIENLVIDIRRDLESSGKGCDCKKD